MVHLLTPCRHSAGVMACNAEGILILLLQLSYAVNILSQRFPGEECTDASGRKGMCRPICLCPQAINPAKGPIINRQCGFYWRAPGVCCPPPEETTVTTTTVSPAPKPDRKTGQKAKRWCKKYSAVARRKVQIVGGEPAKSEEFPHMAAIGYGPAEEPSWNCGGSLISKNFVIPAAHCLQHPIRGKASWVRLGTVELDNSVGGQNHPIIRRIPHPGYHYTSKYNDVALLEIGPALESYAMPTVCRDLHPICLPMPHEPIRTKKAIATGWGKTGIFDDPSPILLKVTLNILESFHCNETYEGLIKSNKSLERGVDSTMVCAGRLCGGRDTCQGDSGGPLQVRIKHPGMFEILGITSFGNMCGCENSPAVYTRVSEYIQWIEDIVWPCDLCKNCM